MTEKSATRIASKIRQEGMVMSIILFATQTVLYIGHGSKWSIFGMGFHVAFFIVYYFQQD